MDNTTILFNSIQRIYRNAIVELIRGRMTAEFGARGIEHVRSQFMKQIELPDGRMLPPIWESVKAAAYERRSGGTGELSTPIRDEYELLGVEYFFNVFEKYFDHLCPAHSDKSKKDRNQAKKVLTDWMKNIKNIRDPVSHPVTDDIGFEDAEMVLYYARKVLDFCELPAASLQVVRARERLLGGFRGESEAILTSLPPEDEVVMDFVGRNRELVALNDWLRNSSAKRWALSGDGGKGKSAIAYAFTRMVSRQSDHKYQGVLWISAKRRRFVEGTTIVVDRPDFHDAASAQAKILEYFGEIREEAMADRNAVALRLLNEFPILLVVDDLDTVEGDGEDAIQFLLMGIPELTKSRVLITSRRVLFGMANLTTQVEGLNQNDCEDFLRSRCDLMGLSRDAVLRLQVQIREATDGSPLYIEDLLRLVQTGLTIEKAIGLWSEHKGMDARIYAMQREFGQLDADAQQALLSLSMQGACTFDELQKGLDWSEDRLIFAVRQLQKMFLMPSKAASSAQQRLSLNGNVQSLVVELFRDTEQFRRTKRLMQAVTGELRPKRREDEEVANVRRRSVWLVKEGDLARAKSELEGTIEKFPGRADLHAALGWVEKKRVDFAAARLHFRRAVDLDCNEPDVYWHWSDMEAVCEEWKSSALVAAEGIKRCGDEQGLLFRAGYAVHRMGRELIRDGEGERGIELCKQAADWLEEARKKGDSEYRNQSLKFRIHRAIALNLEALDDGAALARHFALWQSECPNNPDVESEYIRLRGKYPQFLREH